MENASCRRGVIYLRGREALLNWLNYKVNCSYGAQDQSRACNAPTQGTIRLHTSFINQSLDDAYTAFKTAILPRFPVQELNEQDISNASEALAIWEKSDEISGKYVTEPSKNLVDEMLLATEYLLAHPGGLDLDISLLQERCKALQKKIYLILLNEDLSTNGNLDLLVKASEWTADIESHVLSPGSHALSWYIEKFRKILGFFDASSQIQKNSQIIPALRRLLEVPYIPHFDHLKIVHEILIQSDSLDDDGKIIYATRLSDAVDPRAIPEFSRANIQQKIEAMELACQTGDFSAVRTLADYFEALPKTADDIVFAGIKLALEQSASNIEKSNNSDQQDLVCRLYSIAKRMQHPSSNLLLRPSLYSLDSKERLQVIFRDTSSVEDASFSKHADRRKYDDLILDASPLEPIQALLVRFVEEINGRHRHPFFPVSNFDLFITNKSTTDSSATALHIGPQWFTQGTVADVLLESTSISYTRRDGAQDLQHQQPPFRLLWPFQRQYSVSAPQPPPHWIQTPNVPGPWQEISSVQFIGDGVELTARSTYPPLIARTLLLPKKSSYSMITTSSIQLRRLRISPTLLEARLAFLLQLIKLDRF
ncbi:hypothetical protein BJ912DRAFT_3127 [Pholiota molesta]|nr:hypothetical protein BJ912DRAFT_3127 [Pholiota molesta]